VGFTLRPRGRRVSRGPRREFAWFTLRPRGRRVSRGPRREFVGFTLLRPRGRRVSRGPWRARVMFRVKMSFFARVGGRGAASLLEKMI